MELYELRYFLAVADRENIHHAAKAIAVSPGSLSKAIGRLEDEFGVNLFDRVGRGIQLTEHGQVLRQKARRLLDLSDELVADVGGSPDNLHAIIAGPEILLGEFGAKLSSILAQQWDRHRRITYDFRSRTDQETIKDIQNGDAHIGLTTESVTDVHAKVIGEVGFQTCVGNGHPLAKRRQAIPVEEILEHGFVSPSLPILGQVGKHQSVDGWRDDKFQRRISYRVSSVKLMEKILLEGRAIAYLPEYFVSQIGAKVIEVSGCPYSCHQKIRLVVKRHRELSWLRDLFDAVTA
jgi:DNA-binding transcriptional LysR family regulator